MLKISKFKMLFAFIFVLLLGLNATASSVANSGKILEWKALANRERDYGSVLKQLHDCEWVINEKDTIAKKTELNVLNLAKKMAGLKIKAMTCTTEQKDALKTKLENLRHASFNVASSLTLYSDLGENFPEWVLNSNFTKSIEQERLKFCTDMVAEGYDADDLHDSSLWFAMLLKEGFSCAVQNFKALSWQQGRSGEIQKLFDQIRATAAEPKGDLKGVQIALVPHFSYEYADFQARFGSAEQTIFHDQREVLLYRQLAVALTKRGAVARVLERTTTAELNVQVEQTWQGLAAMQRDLRDQGQTPNILILSRSAGSQVVEDLLRVHGPNVSGVRGWINLGGTPHGSVISDYDTQLDRYYTKSYIGQLGLYPFLQMIPTARNFILQSANVDNIKSLSQLNPATMYDISEKQRSLPILNITLLVDFLEDRTPSTDPVVATQMLAGPTEGSNRVGDSVSESAHSARVFINHDHLYFRDLKADQALHLYLSAIRAYLNSGLEKE